MKCVICDRINTNNLCNKCLKIKNYVSMWGIEPLLSWIYRENKINLVYARLPPYV